MLYYCFYFYFVSVSFSDPHRMANAYEQFVREIKNININAADNGNWQLSASQIHGIDESKSTDYTSPPLGAMNAPSSPPSMHQFSSSLEFERERRRSRKFGFGRKRSSQGKMSSPPAVPNSVTSIHQKAASADFVRRNNQNVNDDHRSSASSTGSTATDATSPRLSGKDGSVSPRDVRSVKALSLESHRGSNSVSMMGVKANAPPIASVSRNSAISGIKSIIFALK